MNHCTHAAGGCGWYVFTTGIIPLLVDLMLVFLMFSFHNRGFALASSLSLLLMIPRILMLDEWWGMVVISLEELIHE
jgi:hypothetical protein